MCGGGEDAGVRFPPPLIYGGLFLAGLAVDVCFGLYPATPDAVRGAGAAIAVFGLVLVAWALAVFRKAGNKPQPWKPDSVLVAAGIYRFTRNPMYLGMALAHLGLALACDSIGALLALPIALLLVDRLVIAREERRHALRFGQDDAAYRAGVRRWL